MKLKAFSLLVAAYCLVQDPKQIPVRPLSAVPNEGTEYHKCLVLEMYGRDGASILNPGPPQPPPSHSTWALFRPQCAISNATYVGGLLGGAQAVPATLSFKNSHAHSMSSTAFTAIDPSNPFL